MILSDSLDNIKYTNDKSKISVPVILLDDESDNNAKRGSMEFDQDVKIWIPKLMRV